MLRQVVAVTLLHFATACYFVNLTTSFLGSWLRYILILSSVELAGLVNVLIFLDVVSRNLVGDRRERHSWLVGRVHHLWCGVTVFEMITILSLVHHLGFDVTFIERMGCVEILRCYSDLRLSQLLKRLILAGWIRASEGIGSYRLGPSLFDGAANILGGYRVSLPKDHGRILVSRRSCLVYFCVPEVRSDNRLAEPVGILSLVISKTADGSSFTCFELERAQILLLKSVWLLVEVGLLGLSSVECTKILSFSHVVALNNILALVLDNGEIQVGRVLWRGQLGKAGRLRARDVAEARVVEHSGVGLCPMHLSLLNGCLPGLIEVSR